MSEIENERQERGWAPFLACCNIVTDEIADVTRTELLSKRREGLVGPDFIHIFANAFEAAIEFSRDEEVWGSLIQPLAAANEQVKFVFPHFSYGEEETGATSTPPDLDLRRILDSFMRCFARAVVRSKNIPPAMPDLFSEFTTSLRAWESDEIHYEIFAPVSNVNVPFGQTTQISSQFRLQHSADVAPNARHFVETLEKEHGRSRIPTVALLVTARAINKAGNFFDFADDVVKDVTRAVTVLRLGVGRVVGCNAACLLPSPVYYQTFNALGNAIWQIPETTIYGHRDYTFDPLSESDVQAVADTTVLLSNDSARQLAIAIERFNLSMGRATPEDQLIDLVIALESTLCRGTGPEQLSFRFRLFGAALLHNVTEYNDVEEMLKKLYDRRCDIVHDGKRLEQLKSKDLIGKSVLEFVADGRQLARHILLQYLQAAAKGCGPKDYNRKLQHTMISLAKKDVEGRMG